MESQPPQQAPSIIAILGITGDLAQRYILPALYHLLKNNLLHEKTEIVGISRRDISLEELFDKVELCVNEVDKVCDPDVIKLMRSKTRMLQMDYDSAEDYVSLRSKLDAIETEYGVCMNRLFYFSIPPQSYSSIIGHMGTAGLQIGCQHGEMSARLLIEKPFGYDLSSAQELVSDTAKVFSEDQVFRIDHYLAKETVQNILTFRFKNPIFEALWNYRHVKSITISASEKIAIEGRADFYDSVGALRDLVQSHLMQVAAIVTMNQPEALTSDAIHASKQAVMRQFQDIPADRVGQRTRRAQYNGYKKEVGSDKTGTETYADITMMIDNDRWKNVPIRLWTGKGLPEKRTEVSLVFQGNQDSIPDHDNVLRFRIQPDEGIELDLVTKKPGYSDSVQTVAMDFSYQENFESLNGHPNAYERVLVDAIRGDHTLFATDDEVLDSWRVVQPVLDEWAKHSDDLISYDIGDTPKLD